MSKIKMVEGMSLNNLTEALTSIRENSVKIADSLKSKKTWWNSAVSTVESTIDTESQSYIDAVDTLTKNLIIIDTWCYAVTQDEEKSVYNTGYIMMSDLLKMSELDMLKEIISYEDDLKKAIKKMLDL